MRNHEIAMTELAKGQAIDGVACRGARSMLGLSQSDLVEAAGCGRKLLNDFENDVRVPGDRKVESIRTALEKLGAIFFEFEGTIGVVVDPAAVSKRTPRARSLART